MDNSMYNKLMKGDKWHTWVRCPKSTCTFVEEA